MSKTSTGKPPDSAPAPPSPPEAAAPSAPVLALFDWLASQWAQQTSSAQEAAQGSLLIDVGAYRGDFSRALLATGSFEQAVLFEPNPANEAALRAHFAGDGRVRIEPLALGAEAADAVPFYCTDDRATGSVLPYAPDALAPGAAVESYSVRLTTLDQYLGRRDELDRVGLLKIDAQGYDLQVLRGAGQTLQASRPWLVVELIFGPLYESQGSPADLLGWLSERGYHLAALFNEHYAEAGWLAFADAVFVPAGVARSYEAPYRARPDPSVLQEEIRMLRSVCAERLALINFLHAEAERRQHVIEQLEHALNAKKSE